MIDKLTATQEALLKEYRDKVFGYTTSTATDKPKAEAAVLRLTEGVLALSLASVFRKSLA